MLLQENTLQDMNAAKNALIKYRAEPISIFWCLPDIVESCGCDGDYEPLSMWLDEQAGRDNKLIIKYLAWVLYGSVDRLTMQGADFYANPVNRDNDMLMKDTPRGGVRPVTRRELIKDINAFINDKRNY